MPVMRSSTALWLSAQTLLPVSPNVLLCEIFLFRTLRRLLRPPAASMSNRVASPTGRWRSFSFRIICSFFAKPFAVPDNIGFTFAQGAFPVFELISQLQGDTGDGVGDVILLATTMVVRSSTKWRVQLVRAKCCSRDPECCTLRSSASPMSLRKHSVVKLPSVKEQAD